MRLLRRPPSLAGALALMASAGACQLVWSYDGFKDQPGTGGRSSSSSASPSSSSSSSGGGSASSSSSSSSSVGGVGGSIATSSGSSSGGDGGCLESGPDGGACTDSCDVEAVAAHAASMQTDLYNCTTPNVGNQAAIAPCMRRTDGLSPGCALCWAALGVCAATDCALSCVGPGGVSGPNTENCNNCLTADCDKKFEACSGTVRPVHMPRGDGGADAATD